MSNDKLNPITHADWALKAAATFWQEMSAKVISKNLEPGQNPKSDPQQVFIKEIFGALLLDPETSGDRCAKEIGLHSGDGESHATDRVPLALLQVMQTVIAYSIQTYKAVDNGAHDEAWMHAADARYWAGILTAAWVENETNPASKMAAMRHAENDALANYAVKYWRENIDPALSAQKAATRLTDIVRLSHKKLAEVISKEKNKLQSAANVSPTRP